jgi:hypothetical protein
MLANDEGVGEEHHAPDATNAATAAEVEGHRIGTSPYLIAQRAHAMQQGFRVEAARQRRATDAAAGQSLVDQVKAMFRGSTG